MSRPVAMVTCAVDAVKRLLMPVESPRKRVALDRGKSRPVRVIAGDLPGQRKDG